MSDNSSNPQRGQYDPGWNDPPKLQYNSSTNQTGKTKSNLNKRIAFPLQSSSTVNTTKPTAIVQPSPSLLPINTLPSANNQTTITTLSSTSVSQPPIAVVPPMQQIRIIELMNRNVPLPELTTTTTDESFTRLINRDYTSTTNSIRNNRNQDTNDDDNDDIELNENTREYCLNIFQRHICKIRESTNVRIDEVQRRINMINQMWLGGTLTTLIQKKLLKIAKALEANNFNAAIEYHRALMVDHSNVCTAWGAALRQIILTIQQQDYRNILENVSSSILIPTVTTAETITTGDDNTTINNSTTINDELQNDSTNNIQHV